MRRLELIVLASILIAFGCAERLVTDDSAKESILAVTSADGTEAAAPATQPALPAGHPALPAGHPALPAGHPALPQGAAANAAPAAPVKTTEQEPEWIIHMRHIMVQPTDKGLRVIDMLAVENPDAAAWIGKADAAGNRSTFKLKLPAGATDVQLDAGFDPKSAVKDETVINSGALQPGASQYRLQYTVPLTNGKGEIVVVAPAPVSAMMIFFPDDGTAISGTGIEGPQTVNMGNGNTRYFKAEDINVGHEVKLSVGQAQAAEKKQSYAVPARAPIGAELAKIVAGVGALLIFLLGGALMCIRPHANRAKKH